MNRIANSLTALAVVAVLMIPLSAREQIPERRESARAIAPWQEKNPYASLFTTQDKPPRDLQKKAPPTVQAVPGRVVAAPPRVVCGMTVFQADPSVDPNILVKPHTENAGSRNLKPMQGNTDFKIRKIEPPICH